MYRMMVKRVSKMGEIGWSQGMFISYEVAKDPSKLNSINDVVLLIN